MGLLNVLRATVLSIQRIDLKHIDSAYSVDRLWIGADDKDCAG